MQYEVFGPLLRFLLQPKREVREAATTFVKDLRRQGGGGDALPLVALHVRAQDSTHNTHVEARGQASRARLEGGGTAVSAAAFRTSPPPTKTAT